MRSARRLVSHAVTVQASQNSTLWFLVFVSELMSHGQQTATFQPHGNFSMTCNVNKCVGVLLTVKCSPTV